MTRGGCVDGSMPPASGGLREAFLALAVLLLSLLAGGVGFAVVEEGAPTPFSPLAGVRLKLVRAGLYDLHVLADGRRTQIRSRSNRSPRASYRRGCAKGHPWCTTVSSQARTTARY